MIEISEAAQSIITRSCTLHIRAQSWLGDQLLASDIPITDGFERVDRNLGVPEYGTLVVPQIADGFNWTPIDDEHPLAANGQRLFIEVGVDIGFGVIEWIPRGWFPIYKSEVANDAVQVTFKGMLQWILEARLVSPFAPTGNFTQAFRSLLEPAINVTFDPTLVDRSVVASTGNFDDSRLDAMYHLLKAWPARARMTEDGDLYIYKPVTADSVLSLTNGVGGTVIYATGSSTREDAYNVVVARGTNASGTPVQGVAYDLEGPKRYGSDFNPLPVPFYFDSTFLHSDAIATAVAVAMLADIKRQTAKSYEVSMLPHPALQVGDVVSLTTDDYTDMLCTVEVLNLPYVHDNNEPMTLTVREI
jgi:hypothetical protein